MINTNKAVNLERPIVTLPGDTYHAYNVKNLGWLVRKSGQWLIDDIAVFEHSTKYGAGALLLISFSNGYTYTCNFASAAILRDWLKARRNMRGVKVTWYDGIGAEQYTL